MSENTNLPSPIKLGLTFWDGKYIGEIDKYINTNQIDKTFTVLVSTTPGNKFPITSSALQGLVSTTPGPTTQLLNPTGSVVVSQLLKVKLITRKSFMPLILEQLKKQFGLYPIEILQCKMSNEDFYLLQDKKGNNNSDVSLIEYISKLKQNNKKLSSIFLNDLRRVLVFKYILGFRKNLAKDIMIRYINTDLNVNSNVDYIYPIYFPENFDELENMSNNPDLKTSDISNLKPEITLYFGNSNETFMNCLTNLCKEINIDDLEKTIHNTTKKYNSTFLLRWLVEVINLVGELN